MRPGSVSDFLPGLRTPEFRVVPIQRSIAVGDIFLKEATRLENTAREAQRKAEEEIRRISQEGLELAKAGRRRATRKPDSQPKHSIQRLADQFEQSRQRTKDRQKPFVFQPFGGHPEHGIPAEPGPAEEPGIESPFIPFPTRPEDEPVPTPIPREPEPKVEEPRIPPDIDCEALSKMLQVLGLPPIVCGQLGGRGLDIRGQLRPTNKPSKRNRRR